MRALAKAKLDNETQLTVSRDLSSPMTLESVLVTLQNNNVSEKQIAIIVGMLTKTLPESFDITYLQSSSHSLLGVALNEHFPLHPGFENMRYNIRDGTLTSLSAPLETQELLRKYNIKLEYIKYKEGYIGMERADLFKLSFSLK